MSLNRITVIITAIALLVSACSEQDGAKKETPEKPQDAEVLVSQIPDSLKNDDLHIEFVYAEERIWETSLAVAIDPPPEGNYAGLDSFFVVVNSNNSKKQHPVAEIGPPRADYDGKWRTFRVIWKEQGFLAHKIVPILESYHDILVEQGLGHLEIKPGSPEGGPPEFFASHLNPLEPMDVIRE
ncbi:MAG: hypothetical protein GF417_07755 [Candidatus Latescibacteria bacterium]|nr:hypothetical protein [bacterium]MBD3424314.1 hypothetical protein [Candidatus Latescibacterota bacterium]